MGTLGDTGGYREQWGILRDIGSTGDAGSTGGTAGQWDTGRGRPEVAAEACRWRWGAADGFPSVPAGGAAAERAARAARLSGSAVKCGAGVAVAAALDGGQRRESSVKDGGGPVGAGRSGAGFELRAVSR